MANEYSHNKESRVSGGAVGGNYWQLLGAATDALQVGDYPAAERRYLDACDLREASPGRVFITEKIGDGLRRIFQRTLAVSGRRGRWGRVAREFINDFNIAAETVVRKGVRLAEMRPEDDAETNQPVLESALFLVTRSRVFQNEPASAVPLLKGLFRTANRTGRPFSVELVRHDLPLTEEDRLWLARKGGELVASFIEAGYLRRGAVEAGEWARVFLQLLQAQYFGTTARLEEERAWLEALTADRLLGRAVESVLLYRAYLQLSPAPALRSDEARIRLLELLGNVDGLNFPAPRYTEALGAMQSAGLAPGSAFGSRYQEAIAKLEYRQPEPEVDGVAQVAPAWASLAIEPDGRVAVVYWWDNEPRDLAFWSPGDSPEALNAFLAPCEGRVVAADDATSAAVTGVWAEEPSPWTATMFVAAVMECKLPASGLVPSALLKLAMAETGPWRTGWRPALGHEWLEPPHSSSSIDTWQQGPAAQALQAGLLMLAVRSRIAVADISLRAGLGEMAKRGDRAAAFLYGFLTLKSETERVLDATFEAWTLPLLWTRADPFGWSGAAETSPGGVLTDYDIRPDLGRNDLTIVTTGNASAVLAAWGDGNQKWRVVLDRMDRLETLTQVASGVVGPVTLIPAGGRVHSLSAALQLLEELLESDRTGDEGLLGIFHWIRLVESHNGDLLDFLQVRPRARGAIQLYERYSGMIANLVTEEPCLAPDGSVDTTTLSTWGGQFSQRVRKAGLVAGTVDHLGTDPQIIDSLWGVFEGSDAAWVFLDSAAVHWTLHERSAFGIQELHTLLQSRGGRHLSVLSAAQWQRVELEELLETWLAAFGSAYCLSLTDTRAPTLRLVDRGAIPESVHLAAEELTSQVAWIEQQFGADGPGVVRVPQSGRAAIFWQDIRSGELPIGGDDWHYQAADHLLEHAAGADEVLVVPVLQSLATGEPPVARQDSPASWAEADVERTDYFAWRRRLCALELAALLAGPWQRVDILDTRWWRLLSGLDGAQASGGKRRSWNGERAARLATDGAARTFDFPSTGLTHFGQVEDWLRRQTKAPLSSKKAASVAAGVTLLLGDHHEKWLTLLVGVATSWERGDLAQYVLYVGDIIPAGATDIVTAGYAGGCSVWRGAAEAKFPAPILWVQPDDMSDSALRRFLDDFPPDSIVADDLAHWLPGTGDNTPEIAQAKAQALRAILDVGANRVMLRASGLSDSWADFLAEACGADIIAMPAAPAMAGEADAAEPAGAHDVVDANVRRKLCLDCGHAGRPEAVASRLRGALARLPEVLSELPVGLAQKSQPFTAGENELLPLSWLGRLAGLTAGDVSEGIRLLRWAARLNGDSLSAAGGAAGKGNQPAHTLLILRRYAELETALNQLVDHLSVLLPLWFESTAVPGLWGQIDLEQPPARVDAGSLALVDSFLSALAESEHLLQGLVYHCPRGLLNSSVRLVGWQGPVTEMLPQILQALEVFRHRLRDLLDTALETGAGFRVETGLIDLRPDEREFLAVGFAMGFWRWLGPASEGVIHVVDVLTLADSPTVKDSPLGWNLLIAQTASRFPATFARDAESSSESRTQLPRLGQLRRLLSTGSGSGDELDPVIARVQEVAKCGGEPALLVLKGMLGTGRHEALVRGLLRALKTSADLGEVVVFCPDEAVAAMVTREFVHRGYTEPLDVRIPASGGSVLAGANPLPALARPETTVIVMCEVQRFDAETRYRVAQLGRGKLLLMTVDPVASVEPWEHLFLTIPRASDIVELCEQRRLSKTIWAEVREMAPEQLQASAGTRRVKQGHLESGYGANLVQSLAHVTAAHRDGTLPDMMRLTTPLAADLEFLGAQLDERGWLAVSEPLYDALFLPGAREILAAIADDLADCGELAISGLVTAAGDPEVSAKNPRRMMARLLGPEAEKAWAEWWDGRDPDPDITLSELVGGLVATPWADTFLRYREARRRCEKLLTEWGSLPVREIVKFPLFEAWWLTMNDHLDEPEGVSRRPLVLLADMARTPAGWVPGAVYLCLGTEPVRRHYEFLGRATDSALVLYQEQSPLPGEQQSP